MRGLLIVTCIKQKGFSWPKLRSFPRFVFIYHVRTSKYVGSKGSPSKAPHSATLILLIAGIWVFEVTVTTSCVRSLRSFVKHEMKKTEETSKSINSVRDTSLSWWWPWSLHLSALCCAVFLEQHFYRHFYGTAFSLAAFEFFLLWNGIGVFIW